jgi:biopolymer transport protein ExbB/TolQ
MFLNDRMRKVLKFTGIILILVVPFIFFAFLRGAIDKRIDRAMEERDPYPRIETAQNLAHLFSAISENAAIPSSGAGLLAERFQQYAAETFARYDRQTAEDFEKAAKTDKIGYGISNLIYDKYTLIITIVYGILAILSLLLLRELYKTFSHLRANRQVPKPGELIEFRKKFEKGTDWTFYYETVVNYGVKNGNKEFWRNLMESASIVDTSKRYDYLYMHLRSRIDEKVQKLGDMPLYDMIATGSPAAGFFGTLLGLIYIFTQSDINISSLAGSYQFWVGLKVAVITSLWGLLNLGLSVFFSYLHRRRTALLQMKLYNAAKIVTGPAAGITSAKKGQVEGVSEYGAK